MANENSVRQQIRDYLSKMNPLTAVTLQEIYASLRFTPEQQASVRAAIYGLCAGTPVSSRNKPTVYYGIRLKLENSRQIILSLPGIPREDLVNDTKLEPEISRIIKRLQDNYGIEVVNYWLKSAQRRSVDQASKGMREAKIRDKNSCRLCALDSVNTPAPVSACHVISRKTLFWKAIDEVEKTVGTGKLFTEEATKQLQNKLKDNELHSSSKFIVTLCHEHNKTLLSALRHALSDQESDQESEQESLLWP